ncbi:MAG: hypothetical protein U1F36_05915 [Planctomycetota bacterium]
MTRDLAKVRAYLRKMPHHFVFAMLDEAVGMLPRARLDLLVRRYISAEGVKKEVLPSKTRPPLRALVKDFVDRSRRGYYFESFNVNSKNCTEQSNGTTAWIADCNRLLDRCVARAKVKRGRSEALEALESLFDIIDLAASCERDVVFFADEGGLWSFGIDWKVVVEAWTTCAAHVEVADGDIEARATKVLARFGKAGAGIGRAAAARRARAAEENA